VDAAPLDRLWQRGRTSAGARVRRWQSKSWHIAQAAVAAGVAWLIASDLLGHETPFFAPLAAVVCLGTSYGQRLRRVGEVALGVAVGVLIGDLFVLTLGSGWWQLMLLVSLAMSVAFLLDGGQLFVMQASIQSIVVATLIADPSQALTRWTDALIGGAVALVAATAVPAAPLRRPRQQAGVVMRKIASLLRAASDVMESGELEPALELLADARNTDRMIDEMRAAADEGLAVVASSPFRVRHRDDLRRMAEVVEPLDKALRTTRVLVRRTAVAAHHRRPVPSSYARFCDDLADACDAIADEMSDNRSPAGVRDRLLELGRATAQLERTHALSIEVVLAQLRSLVADLLELSGMEPLEATDALPPPMR